MDWYPSEFRVGRRPWISTYSPILRSLHWFSKLGGGRGRCVPPWIRPYEPILCSLHWLSEHVMRRRRGYIPSWIVEVKDKYFCPAAVHHKTINVFGQLAATWPIDLMLESPVDRAEKFKSRRCSWDGQHIPMTSMGTRIEIYISGAICKDGQTKEWGYAEMRTETVKQSVSDIASHRASQP